MCCIDFRELRDIWKSLKPIIDVLLLLIFFVLVFAVLGKSPPPPKKKIINLKIPWILFVVTYDVGYYSLLELTHQ